MAKHVNFGPKERRRVRELVSSGLRLRDATWVVSVDARWVAASRARLVTERFHDDGSVETCFRRPLASGADWATASVERGWDSIDAIQRVRAREAALDMVAASRRHFRRRCRADARRYALDAITRDVRHLVDILASTAPIAFEPRAIAQRVAAALEGVPR